jgi:hypothetical protein
MSSNAIDGDASSGKDASGMTQLAGKLARISAALLEARDFDQALRAVEDGRQQLLGDGYLTVNVDATPPDSGDEMWLQRLWSANPEAYPVSGRKRKLPSPWTQHVLKECRVLVSAGDAAIAQHFDDHALMKSTGIHCTVNYPLAVNGRYAATVNINSTRSEWSEYDVALGALLAQLARPWILREIGKE